MNRVLVVDDERHVIDGIRRMMKRANFAAEVIGDTSPVEALEHVLRDPVDLIISDINMPEMDGIELLTRLKSSSVTEHIPVMVLTGRHDDEVRRAALSLGALDFLTKPADPFELQARIRNGLTLMQHRRDLAEHAQKLSDQLERSQKLEMLGLIAAGVLHDIKNYLFIAGGQAEMAVHSGQLDAKSVDRLQKAISGMSHAAKLARRGLDLTRPGETGVGGCDLSQVITEMLDWLKASAKDRITIVWEPPPFDTGVTLDNLRASQLLMNLCLNAISAIQNEGQLTVTLAEDCESAVDCRQLKTCGRNFLILRVSDSGRGMDVEASTRIFEPMYSTDRARGGSGIGLSIVQHIIGESGGTITIESTENVGTTFVVCLPRALQRVDTIMNLVEGARTE